MHILITFDETCHPFCQITVLGQLSEVWAGASSRGKLWKPPHHYSGLSSYFRPVYGGRGGYASVVAGVWKPHLYKDELRLLDPTRNFFNLPPLHEEHSLNRQAADLRLVLLSCILRHIQTILCDNLVSKEKLAVCQTAYSDSSSSMCYLFHSVHSLLPQTTDLQIMLLVFRRNVKVSLTWDSLLHICSDTIHVNS